jgi:hypothetical protein
LDSAIERLVAAMIEAAPLECECLANKLVTKVRGVSDLNHIFAAQPETIKMVGKKMAESFLWTSKVLDKRLLFKFAVGEDLEIVRLKGEHEI